MLSGSRGGARLLPARKALSPPFLRPLAASRASARREGERRGPCAGVMPEPARGGRSGAAPEDSQAAGTGSSALPGEGGAPSQAPGHPSPSWHGRATAAPQPPRTGPTCEWAHAPSSQQAPQSGLLAFPTPPRKDRRGTAAHKERRGPCCPPPTAEPDRRPSPPPSLAGAPGVAQPATAPPGPGGHRACRRPVLPGPDAAPVCGGGGGLYLVPLVEGQQSRGLPGTGSVVLGCCGGAQGHTCPARSVCVCSMQGQQVAPTHPLAWPGQGERGQSRGGRGSGTPLLQPLPTQGGLRARRGPRGRGGRATAGTVPWDPSVSQVRNPPSAAPPSKGPPLQKTRRSRTGRAVKRAQGAPREEAAPPPPRRSAERPTLTPRIRNSARARPILEAAVGWSLPWAMTFTSRES